MSGVRCGSTMIFGENGIDVKIAKTGVKLVHACAKDNFDVGIF